MKPVFNMYSHPAWNLEYPIHVCTTIDRYTRESLHRLESIVHAAEPVGIQSPPSVLIEIPRAFVTRISP